jgi:hypothetical protein
MNFAISLLHEGFQSKQGILLEFKKLWSGLHLMTTPEAVALGCV